MSCLCQTVIGLLSRVRSIPPASSSFESLQQHELDTWSYTRILESISDACRVDGYSREAETLLIALEQCVADADHGGRGIQTSTPLSQSAQDLIAFEVEAWLESLNSEDRAWHPQEPLRVPPTGRGPMTLAQKILSHHATKPIKAAGPATDSLIQVFVDWVIASDLTWTGLFDGLTKAGIQRVFRNDRLWIAGDHRVDPRNYHTMLSKKLLGAMTKGERKLKLTQNQGANYTIMHTEFVRQRALPGDLVIGSDSHTCSAGAVGALAIGLGLADNTLSLITGETWFKIPESISISFVGDLPPGIGGKDVVLHILGQLKRNTAAANRIIEYGGPSAKRLSIDARFAICNMSTELGAVTGIFTADEVTQSFIHSRKRYRSHQGTVYFRADADAQYAESYTIDLSEVKSSIALFPSPDNVVPITDKVGLKLNGCFIGACTTAEEDLVLAGLVLRAGLVRESKIAPGTRHMTPGSKPIMRKLEALGLLDDYTAAGFTIGAPGCSYCAGVVDTADAESVWLSSQNRNFHDRMGKGAIGNLASAAAVAASSFSMQVTNPSELLKSIDKSVWESYLHSKCPAIDKIRSGCIEYLEPNFEPKPETLPVAADGVDKDVSSLGSDQTGDVAGKVIRLGDFIDTDAIISSDFLATAGSDDELAEHCMEYFQPDFRDRVRSGQTILVAGKSFGVGSSREQAPRALKALGIQAVIAQSFAFIYARNQPNIGLLGIKIDDQEFYEMVGEGVDMRIDVSARQIWIENKVFPFELDPMELALIKYGGLSPAYEKLGRDVFARLAAGGTTSDGVPVMEVSLQKKPGMDW